MTHKKGTSTGALGLQCLKEGKERGVTESHSTGSSAKQGLCKERLRLGVREFRHFKGFPLDR